MTEGSGRWRNMACVSVCECKLLRDNCKQFNGNAICSQLSELTSTADGKWMAYYREKSREFCVTAIFTYISSSCPHVRSNAHGYSIMHVEYIERMTCGVCCLRVWCFLSEVLSSAGRCNAASFQWLCTKATNIYCTIRVIHSLIWLSRACSLIFLSQFFFLPCSFTLLCISLTGRREAVSPRESEGGRV